MNRVSTRREGERGEDVRSSERKVDVESSYPAVAYYALRFRDTLPVYQLWSRVWEVRLGREGEEGGMGVNFFFVGDVDVRYHL